MSMTFTKLFSSITESTIWTENSETRLVWITMLAMADSRGRVWASIPGLANRARVTIEHVESALEKFLGPDKYSRTPDNEGRRIEVIDGGWRLLNHAKYRAIRDDEAIKESKRNYINTRRAKERSVEGSRTPSNGSEDGRANAESESDAKADTEGSKKPVAASAEVQPPTIEEAISYAQNGASTPIKTEIVEQWHLDRAKVGWMVCKAGDQYPMKDWRSDLRSYAQTWKRVSEERQARTPKQPTRQPGHHRNSCL